MNPGHSSRIGDYQIPQIFSKDTCTFGGNVHFNYTLQRSQVDHAAHEERYFSTSRLHDFQIMSKLKIYLYNVYYS